MDFFNATFYDRYTPLTEAQILEKLTPAPVPAGEGWLGLAGRRFTLLPDGGAPLRYAFRERTLTLTEGDGKSVEAPYAARELSGAVLVTHMIPGTLRGYVLILEEAARLCTVFEVWFGSFAPDRREVWREYRFGRIDAGDGAPPSERRHGLTNRFEGTGTHWRDDDGREWLCFFPSVVWSSFVELSDPRGGITITAPSDYIRISDSLLIYSRVEQEFSGAFTLELIDLMRLRHVGVRLGFNREGELVYGVYGGVGEFTGRCTNLEPLTDYGKTIPFQPAHLEKMAREGRGSRPSYRPRFLHKDFTQEETDALVANNLRLFENNSVMSSRNTMEISEYMNGKRFTLRFDDGPAWDYEILETELLRWRAEGEADWHEERYRSFEPAPDVIFFSHVCTGSQPLRCLTHAVDFSTGLVTCVDAVLGNGRKAWEVGHKAIFGVLDMPGGPTPPVTRRHGFTRELLGKCFSWTYSDAMQSIHVYSTPESYSWTIMLPNNTGGWMWSSPCLYVKLRDDAWLMSWTEDDCNGNQGTFVFNPRIMHDAGFFFGVGGTAEAPDVHLHEFGAYARPLAGYELDKYF